MASPTCRLSDIPIPPQCRDLIERGALVAVNSSGGKDSQCMTILLSRLVPREQLLVVHAPLGTVEWPGTIEHVENTIPPGLPLVLARTASWKTLLERIEKRGRFPDSGRRYFTSDHKRSPIERELRHYLKAHPQFGGRLVNAMGMRAEESAARAGKLPWRRSDLNSRAGRSWFDWLPIFGMTETQVFAVIRDAGQSPHPAYGMGMSSLSCVFCVMASRADLRTAARLQPALYRRFVRLEERIGHTLSPTRVPLPALTGVPVEPAASACHFERRSDKGERRFIATIARRRDSLGAITRGQRDSQTAMGSGDQALFRESDNLESVYAKAALQRFYIALWRGHIEGWSLDRFEDTTGLKLVYEGNLKEELPPMPRFLNRLLALPIAEQNQLFAELEARIAENIEQAIEAGSFEVGVETVRANSLTIAGRETLYEHPGTGAATDLVEIRRRDRLVPLTADAALDIGGREPGADGKPSLAVNARSKRAAVLLPAPSRMFDDGGVQERVRLVRPATRETMARPELDASNWRRTDEAQWRTLWEHEIAELPSHRESRFWLAAGLLLPIWDRLPFENMRVRRLTTDDGEALIGRVLDAEQVRAARASFGLDGGPAMTGEEAFEAVMGRGTSLPLANGWRLARRRIMGADRVEIEGPADTDVGVLRRIGCTVEIVSYRARAFAPAAQVLDRVLERWPLAA